MVYAFWNQDAENGRGGYEVDTRTEFQLLPVSQHLQQTWRDTYLQGDSNHAEYDYSVPCTYCNVFFCASTASMGYGESE